MGNSAPVYKEMSRKEVIVYNETAILGRNKNGQSISSCKREEIKRFVSDFNRTELHPLERTNSWGIEAPERSQISSNASGREGLPSHWQILVWVSNRYKPIFGWHPNFCSWLARRMNKRWSERIFDWRMICFSVGCIFFYYLTEGTHPFSVNELSNDIDIIGRITNKLEIDPITSFVTNF